tara:strand:+ start:378 stop:827 length:450 start_codon:yes stop_codon:yes gene_type:complete
MKLFKVITVLISLLLTTSALADNNKPGDTKGHIGDMPAPLWLGGDVKYSMTQFLFRRTQFLRFSLKREEKKMHESAVFFALNNTQNGKIVSWYSNKRLAAGKVRVIHSYPISGGYCRTYQAYIKVNGKERHMTNNACKRITSVSWSFYK